MEEIKREIRYLPAPAQAVQPYVDARVIQPSHAVGGVSGPAGGAAGGAGGGTGGGSAGGASASGQAAQAAARQTDEFLKKALATLIASQKPGAKKRKGGAALRKARRSYAQAKKMRNKQIALKKKAENAAAKKRIAQMPKKQRVAARKAFRAAQKEKYIKLKKQMPAASKLGVAEIRTYLKRMGQMRI